MMFDKRVIQPSPELLQPLVALCVIKYTGFACLLLQDIFDGSFKQTSFSFSLLGIQMVIL